MDPEREAFDLGSQQQAEQNDFWTHSQHSQVSDHVSPAPSSPPEPVRDSITEKLLYQLRDELNKQNEKTIFTCGGTIPIHPPTPGSAGRANRSSQGSGADAHSNRGMASLPVTVRWDPRRSDAPASETKLVFPREPETQNNLEKLVRDMQPASFGYKGKDVYDETYRKALKMDTEKFATTFNPYELGIIDTISQVLLPNVPGADVHRGVRAELYKLNVYSSPSGKFKPHIDTPRGNAQFGSLVVCLPVEHEGGQLQVRHKGREITYDWGTARDGISWAAFYSDCEHEVLEVTSGHRLTLTYNLYAVRGGSGLAGGFASALDVSQLSFYRSLEWMVKSESFMPNGGYLGFYCSHAYAHTTGTKQVVLPDMLKGLDMMIWETFGRLGLDTQVKPVLKYDNGYDETKLFLGNSTEYYMSGWCRVEGEEAMSAMIEEWRGGENLEDNDIFWLSAPKHEELQLTYIAYGNQESLESMYSYCAIIAQLPPYAERKH